MVYNYDEEKEKQRKNLYTVIAACKKVARTKKCHYSLTVAKTKQEEIFLMCIVPTHSYNQLI